MKLGRILQLFLTLLILAYNHTDLLKTKWKKTNPPKYFSLIFIMKELLCQEDTWLVLECCFLIWTDFRIIYFSKCCGRLLRSEHQLPVHKQMKNIERLSRITPSRDCGMLIEAQLYQPDEDLESSCVIITSPFHQCTPGSLFSL